jgi:hypothetical protein
MVKSSFSFVSILFLLFEAETSVASVLSVAKAFVKTKTLIYLCVLRVLCGKNFFFLT